MTIGKVRSMTEPAKWYEIRRLGRPVKGGGQGVLWTCSCPAYHFGHGAACKHLVGLFAGKAKARITKQGFKILRARYKRLGIQVRNVA